MSHLINHRSGHWNFFSWVSSKTRLEYINIAVTFIYYFTSVVSLSKPSLESKAVDWDVESIWQILQFNGQQVCQSDTKIVTRLKYFSKLYKTPLTVPRQSLNFTYTNPPKLQVCSWSEKSAVFLFKKEFWYLICQENVRTGAIIKSGNSPPLLEGRFYNWFYLLESNHKTTSNQQNNVSSTY